MFSYAIITGCTLGLALCSDLEVMEIEGQMVANWDGGWLCAVPSPVVMLSTRLMKSNLPLDPLGKYFAHSTVKRVRAEHEQVGNHSPSYADRLPLTYRAG